MTIRYAKSRKVSLRLRSGARALGAAVLGVLVVVAVSPVVASETLAQTQRFQFELWAQNHCPIDTVVWVTASSQTYNSRAERWYGRTKDGAFACKLDAEKAGYRAKSPL